jgi:hypothetical protein
MDDDGTRQSVLFSDLLNKPVVAKCDQEHASSDGGAILLQACDRRLGLTEALIEAIDDRRQSGKIRHAIGDLVRQRPWASLVSMTPQPPALISSSWRRRLNYSEQSARVFCGWGHPHGNGHRNSNPFSIGRSSMS